VETLQAYLAAFPHIGETGFLFRRNLPAQRGGIQLQRGRNWVAFWRENRILPDGTVKRVLRGKSLGMTGERKRPGPKPNATITQATDLRKAGMTWSEIYAQVSPNAELTNEQQHRGATWEQRLLAENGPRDGVHQTWYNCSNAKDQAIYKRVATKLGVTVEHVRSVARGQRHSEAVSAAINKELLQR
jgi:hypothetical protein